MIRRHAIDDDGNDDNGNDDDDDNNGNDDNDDDGNNDDNDDEKNFEPSVKKVVFCFQIEVSLKQKAWAFSFFN